MLNHVRGTFLNIIYWYRLVRFCTMSFQFKINDYHFIQEVWTLFLQAACVGQKTQFNLEHAWHYSKLIDSVIVINATQKKGYYYNTKPYETMTYCCAEFEWYSTDSITDRTLNSRRPGEMTGEEWHLHKAEWRPEGSKNRHCNKRARFAKTANVAVMCQYHLWAQRGGSRECMSEWKARKRRGTDTRKHFQSK